MRIRFTIRDLLWLTAVMALAVGWWLDACRRAEQMDELNARLVAPNAEQAVRTGLEWLARHPQP
jgi:hypothetical protein